MDFDLIKKHVTPNLILDIGCNIGAWYQEAKAAFPRAEFILFDANPECAPLLDLLNVKYHIAILSDEEKDIDFYTLKDCATAVGASYYRENTPFFTDDKISVNYRRTTRLDELMHGVPYIHREILLKLDTQGSELDVLNGGKRLLAWTNTVILEVSHVEYNRGAPNAAQVAEYMSRNGFYVVEKLGTMVHPIERHHIQTDVMYRRFIPL